MAQSKIDHFFGQSRGNANTKGVGIGGGAPSDDDAPMIPPGFRIIAASDILAHRSAKRSKFEGEAEECSDDDDASSASDSFVVSDHASDVTGSSSPEAQDSLREICACLRNRKKFLHCPQCLRLVRVILRFLADIVDNMPDS